MSHEASDAPEGDSLGALLGSSEHRGIGDDASKDADNAAWVMDLDPEPRAEWIRRIRWIRVADRLCESDRIDPGARRFGALCDRFGATRREASGDPTRAALLDACAGYLHALHDYHEGPLALRTLREHDAMLLRLSGHLFQIFPYLRPEHASAAAELGRVDQLVNNLRDLDEDARHGLCYFPDDVLGRFQLTRERVISGECARSPAWRAMMGFWLDEHLPALRRRAAPFLAARDLHPSLEIMRGWTVDRHARIVRALREVDLDFRDFPAHYWGARAAS